MIHPIAKSVLKEAPAYLAVSLATMKSYLRIDGDSEDSIIESMIKAATIKLENYTNKKFVTQKWEIYFDHFPCQYVQPDWEGVKDGALNSLYAQGDTLELPFGPLKSVQKFSTFDDSAEYVFANSNFILDTASPFGKISLKSGSVWPATVLRATNGIKILATFGMGEGAIPANTENETPAVESKVPQDIQEAIKVMTAALYEHRGDEMPTLPSIVQLLLEPHRRIQV